MGAMTRNQWAFLMLLAGAMLFAVGSVITPMYNAGQTSNTWGMIGGLCWLFGPGLFLCGAAMAVLEALRPQVDVDE
jgi:drug/metabolite transporter (DMT)-like permease